MSEQEPSALKSAVRRGRPPKPKTLEDLPRQAPVHHTPPKELPPEQQLKSVMEQIKVATGGDIMAAPIGAHAPKVDQPPNPPPEAMEPPTPLPVVPPPPTFQSGNQESIIQEFDVVQVMNQHNRLFGTMFIVGDTDGERVHGFHFQPGGKKEFITVNLSEIVGDGRPAVIGSSRVRAKDACSSKWRMDHGKPNNL